MKKLLSLFTFMLFATVLLNSCRNPAYEMNVLFDADVIKYKATLILKGANGEALPNNITVEAEGKDAASIYDFSGTKKIYAPAGVITLGVTPKGIPVGGTPLSFNIKITAPGYEDKNIEMTISENQFSQVIDVTMLKTITTTEASVVKTGTQNLSTTGATTAALTVTTDNTGTVAQASSVVVPANTQFKDATGNTLTGSSLTLRVINFEAANPLSIDLFPAGSLSSSNVVGPDGATGETFFLPAAFADVQMFVGGVEVKSFTSPIEVSLQLDPTFKPQSTGQLVKVGDVLDVYSYHTETGIFTYEQKGTVALDGAGKLAVKFSITHLTTFIVGDAIHKPATCTDPVVTFNAPWLGTGAQPLDVSIYNADDKLLDSRTVQVSDKLVDTWRGLPSSIALKYKISTIGATPTILAEGSIVNACSAGTFSITLAQPNTGTPIQNITLILNVRCPSSNSFITVPNFDLFYKPVGAPSSQYVLLGTAAKGMIVTPLLKIGSSYDFRATWGSQTKEVKNRTISALDMSTVVGENDFLGSKSPQYNKSLLIEACKGF